MEITFTLEGSAFVPEGTVGLTDRPNQFLLPTGEIIRIQAVIEIETFDGAGDHHDATTAEAEALGLSLKLYARNADLSPGD